jgi:hypothetical protein
LRALKENVKAIIDVRFHLWIFQTYKILRYLSFLHVLSFMLTTIEWLSMYCRHHKR